MIIKSEKYGSIDTGNLKLLGYGRYYEVYKLDDSKVLKFMYNEYTSHSFPSITKLNDIPMIPEIYEFSEKQNYHIMQYIDGIKIGDLEKKNALSRFLLGNPNRISFYIKNKFDFDEYMYQVDSFFQGCIGRGYYPKDLHRKNVLLDHQKKLWVIDVDQFLDVTKHRIGNGYKKSSEYKNMVEHGKKAERFINNTDDFPERYQPHIKMLKNFL